MGYKRYQPVFLDINGRLCVIVGGGKIAYEKVSVLLESGAKLRIVSPGLESRLTDLIRDSAVAERRKISSEGRKPWDGTNPPPESPGGAAPGSLDSRRTAVFAPHLEWRQKPYDDSDLDGAFLVIAATDDPTLNRQVSAAAEARGKLANAVDDAEYCNFIFGAVAKAGPLQVAVSSAGTSPIIAQQVRDHVQQSILTDELGVLAEFAGDWRPAVKKAIQGFEARKRFWKDLLASRVPALLAEGKKGKAARALKELLRPAIHHSIGDASPESVSPRQYALTGSEASTDSPRQRTQIASEAGTDSPRRRTQIASEAGTDSPRRRTQIASEAGTDSPRRRTPIASEASVVIPSEARDTSNPTSSGDAPASLLARSSPPDTPAQQPNRRKSA